MTKIQKYLLVHLLLLTLPGAASAQISQLTGDVTAGPGSGSQAATLATAQPGSHTWAGTNAFGVLTGTSLALNGTLGLHKLSVNGSGHFTGKLNVDDELNLDGPISAINAITPASYATPGFVFNDLGTTGFSFPNTAFHIAMAVTGNKSNTGTGGYTGLFATQYCANMESAGFCTANFSTARGVVGGTRNDGSFFSFGGYTLIPTGMAPTTVME